MAGDEERLVILLEARVRDLEKNMAKAQGITARAYREMSRGSKSATRQMEADMIRSTSRINQALAATSARIGDFSRAFVAGIAGAATIGAAKRLIDASTGIANALKVTGLEGGNLKAVYDSLFASAQKNGAPLEALVTLYGRASQAAGDLKASQADLLTFTDRIALALRVSGQSAEESSGALLQLSQALGNGKVQAEEYNSLLDGGRPILQAVAAGLKEAGGSVSNLTRLVKNGQVSSEAFFRAFLAGAPILERQVAGAEETLSQRLARLQNVLIDTAGKFDKTTGASEFFGQKIDQVAGTIEGFGKALDDFGNGPLGTFLGKLADGVGTLDRFVTLIGGLKNLPALEGAIIGVVGDKLAGTNKTGEAAIQGRIDRAFDVTAPKTTAKTSRLKAATDAAVEPITLASYPVPANSKGKGGRRGERAYENESRQIKERTAAIAAMTTAQAQLNPLLDDYDYSVSRAQAAQDLLSAAQRAGTAAGKELKNVQQLLSGDFDGLSKGARDQAEAMVKLAEEYASAEAGANKLAAAQDFARQRMDDIRGLGKDVFGGFITDLTNGTSAAESLANALGKIGDKLLEIGLNSLFDPQSRGGGDILGGVFGGLFGGSQISKALSGGIGFYAGGGVANTPSIFGEAGPEAAVPLPDGRRIPVDLRGQGGGGQAVKVDVGVSVDDEGKLKAVIKSVSKGEAEGALQNYRNSDRMTQDVGVHYTKAVSRRYVR